MIDKCRWIGFDQGSPLHAGDRVVAVDGRPLDDWLAGNAERPVLHDGTQLPVGGYLGDGGAGGGLPDGRQLDRGHVISDLAVMLADSGDCLSDLAGTKTKSSITYSTADAQEYGLIP